MRLYEQAKEEYSDVGKQALYHYFSTNKNTEKESIPEIEELMAVVNSTHQSYQQVTDKLDKALEREKQQAPSTIKQQVNKALGEQQQQVLSDLLEWYNNQQAKIREQIMEMEENNKEKK